MEINFKKGPILIGTIVVEEILAEGLTSHKELFNMTDCIRLSSIYHEDCQDSLYTGLLRPGTDLSNAITESLKLGIFTVPNDSFSDEKFQNKSIYWLF